MDQTFALIREPFTFIPDHCGRIGKPILKTRLMYKDAYLLYGKAAAEIFQDTELFDHKATKVNCFERAMLGPEGIIGISGEFSKISAWEDLNFITSQSVENLCSEIRVAWCSDVRRWSNIVLLEELHKVMLWAACGWCGIPITTDEVDSRANHFHNVIYGCCGSWKERRKARKSRYELEKWVTQIVSLAQQNQLPTEPNSFLSRMAKRRDQNGNIVKVSTVVPQVMALLRQVVDLARYVVFSALALEKNYELIWQLELNEMLRESFAYEVLRYYPLSPFLTASVKQDFVWDDVTLTKGKLALLDIYGCNHDWSAWDGPHEFVADRFIKWTGEPFSIESRPEYYNTYPIRCAYDQMVVVILKEAIRILVSEFDYSVPVQDLTVALNRVRPIPHSGFLIGDIHGRKPYVNAMSSNT